MRPKVLLAAAAALLLAACNAADSTGPGTLRQPGPPSADGNGQFGSGGIVPPPDTTQPHP
jgi:hypothetical protein